MGTLLYRGIVSSDYTIIQGVVFIMIVTTSLAVLLIDLLNPLLDPRISY
jgi:peptide/nickel transport system permease protein